MNIDHIHIKNFGKHKNLKLNTKPGLNIIYGPNEAGKSTIQAFIKAMLYGLNHRTRAIKTNDRLKYSPWDGSKMGGQIIFTHDNIKYSVSREFGKTKRSDKLSFINEVTGEEVVVHQDGEPGEWLFDITQETFENTVFINQISSCLDSDKDKNEEILTKLSNLASTGDEELSVKLVEERIKQAMLSLHSARKDKGIIDKLQVERNELIDELNTYKAIKHKTESRISMIHELEKEASSIDKYTSTLKTRREKIENLILAREFKKISNYINQKEDLLIELDSYLKDLTFNNEVLTKNKLNRVIETFNEFKEKYRKLEIYKNEYLDAEMKLKALQEEVDRKSYLEDLDYDSIQKVVSKIDDLNNISRKYDALLVKINAFREEIDRKSLELEDTKAMLVDEVNKTRGKLLPSLMILLGLVSTVCGFIFSPILFIVAGISFIICGITYVIGRNKLNSIKSDYDRKIAYILEEIKDKETKLNMSLEQVNLLFLGEEDVNEGNLKSVIENLNQEANMYFARCNCRNLSELNHQLTEFKSLKLRLNDYLDRFQEEKERYFNSESETSKLRNCFISEYKFISDLSNASFDDNLINKISTVLTELMETLNKVVKLKDNISHINDLINSLLRGKDLEELKNKANVALQNLCQEDFNVFDENKLHNELNEINSKLEEANLKQIELHKKIADEKSLLSAAFNGIRDEEELLPFINEINEKLEDYEYYYNCLQIAKDVLSEAFDEMQQSFGPILNNKTCNIFKFTTSDKYNDVRINRNFDIVLKQYDDAIPKESDYLSTGAVEQLYFSLRMAIIDLILKDKYSIPLFLDDPFVHYDDVRCERILDQIFERSRNQQIFIFTCHERILNFYYKFVNKYDGSDSFSIINL